MSTVLEVSRVVGGELVHVGTIRRAGRGAEETFEYADSYLERDGASPISFSLPLSQAMFSAREMRPYFAGLLPEGPAREALVGQLCLPGDDYLAMLAAIGLECIGDVVVQPTWEGSVPAIAAWDGGSYAPLDADDMRATLSSLPSLSRSNGESRLSLAGSQGKVGLAHVPGVALSDGWMRPLGGAASTHILKTSVSSRIADFEIVCMGAARACGLRVAGVDGISFGTPAACVERFDRKVSLNGGELQVERLHQEDMAQAFGMAPAEKYAELEGGSYAAVALLLESRSLLPLEDIDELARIAVFNYLVGNCDNHLKNLSVTHEGSSVRLTPAYDIVCTTFFERFSREMGMRLGSTRMIDDVVPSDFAQLAKDLGMGVRRMRGICSDLVDGLPGALAEAGERGSSGIETLPYSAGDVIEEARPRMAVVASFTRGG